MSDDLQFAGIPTQAMAQDAQGDSVIVWTDNGTVFAQRYDAYGSPTGGAIAVNTTIPGFQDEPSVAMDAAGDFIVAWQTGDPSGDGFTAYAQQFNSAGAAVGSVLEFGPEGSGPASPSVAMDAAGDFVVVWDEYQSDGFANVIYSLHRTDGTGITAIANASTYGGLPDVAMNPQGDFVITWAGQEKGISSVFTQIYAETFNLSGISPYPEFPISTITTGNQYEPSAALSGSGQFVIAWVDGSESAYAAHRRGSTPGPGCHWGPRSLSAATPPATPHIRRWRRMRR